MIIDASHRTKTEVCSLETYQVVADQCVSTLLQVPHIGCVAVCGSLAKADVVPGWSDIDLIIFVDDSPDYRLVLSEIRRVLSIAAGKVKIAIGSDIVYFEEFKRTFVLCGRPIYTTYDIAAYATIHGRHNAFSILPPFDGFLKRVIVERRISIGAELHNWRRAAVGDTLSALGETGWTSKCIKTLLKLLQYETGPLMTPPFTYRGSLSKLQTIAPSHPTLSAFSEAVEARSNWLQISLDESRRDCVLDVVTRALSYYPNS